MMSRRCRTVKWMEGRIINELGRKSITTYLAMSSLVLKDVRSIEEQHNLDIAIINLISQGVIKRYKDNDGYTVFSLAA